MKRLLTPSILQPGGVISIYGMTTSPTMPFQMAAVLKNIEVRGSTMGSRKQFGKLVIEVSKEREAKL
jgi:D-arabinose 1-dehydrogenase-like Zn-dependent alcohol dehydrogenase